MNMLLYKRQVYYSAQDMLNLLQQLGKDSLDVATIVRLGNAQAAQVGLDSYDEARGIYTNVSPLLPTPPVQGPSGPAPTPEGTIVKTVANSPAFTDESLEQPLSLSGAVVEGDFLFNPDDRQILHSEASVKISFVPVASTRVEKRYLLLQNISFLLG